MAFDPASFLIQSCSFLILIIVHIPVVFVHPGPVSPRDSFFGGQRRPFPPLFTSGKSIESISVLLGHIQTKVVEHLWKEYRKEGGVYNDQGITSIDMNTLGADSWEDNNVTKGSEVSSYLIQFLKITNVWIKSWTQYSRKCSPQFSAFLLESKFLSELTDLFPDRMHRIAAWTTKNIYLFILIC